MPHADSLILTLVGGFVLAFVFGMLANRLKLSPLVGYLVAGVVVGPHTAGFVADTELAPQLAEIGVILLILDSVLSERAAKVGVAAEKS